MLDFVKKKKNLRWQRLHKSAKTISFTHFSNYFLALRWFNFNQMEKKKTTNLLDKMCFNYFTKHMLGFYFLSHYIFREQGLSKRSVIHHRTRSSSPHLFPPLALEVSLVLGCFFRNQTTQLWYSSLSLSLTHTLFLSFSSARILFFRVLCRPRARFCARQTCGLDGIEQSIWSVCIKNGLRANTGHSPIPEEKLILFLVNARVWS